MSIEDTDKASAAIAKAPRVSLADIAAAIDWRFFTTAEEAMRSGQGEGDGDPEVAYLKGRLMTICICVMKNGFLVIGKSAPASPENFNIEIGKKFAYEDCVRQLWQLLGYELKSHLHQRSMLGAGAQQGSDR